MNEQEFVQIQLDWLREQYKRIADPAIAEAIIRAIVDITSTALVEGVFPAFDSDKVE